MARMGYDWPIVVIGAGAGGLVVANGAAKAGKKVLLIEKGTWGGDCTNFGCVPSKSLIASAHIAHAIRHGQPWGIVPKSTEFDSSAVMPRVRDIVAGIRGHEEPEALKKNGVETIEGVAKFIDPHTLEVDGKKITAAKIVIATGSYPVKFNFDVPYCNNECVFELEKVPKSLIVLGAGPIGCELGQAFSRLGSRVTIVHTHSGVLMREEPEAQVAILETFQNEGIELLLDAEVTGCHQDGDIVLTMKDGRTATGEVLLVGAGRRPNIEKLELDAAGIKYGKRGIETDPYGRTNHKHIFAIGDCTTGAPFTHMAEAAGRAVLTTLLTPGPFKKKLEPQDVPRCTYVDPEVASVGISEAQAIEKYGAKKVAAYTVSLADIDRAIATSRTEGFVKIVTLKWSSKILGATIVAPRAGEMLPEISLAMREKIPLRKLASLIHAYPTFNHAIRAAADQWLTRTIVGALK